MRYNSLIPKSKRRRFFLLSFLLLPFVFYGVLREVSSWRPQLLLKTGGIGDIAYSPTEPLLACTMWKGMNSEVQMWDMRNRALLWRKSAPQANHYLAFSPDGMTLADADASVVLWDAHSGKRLRALSTLTELQLFRSNQLQFAPDGKTIEIFSEGFERFDVASGQLVGKAEIARLLRYF